MPLARLIPLLLLTLTTCAWGQVPPPAAGRTLKVGVILGITGYASVHSQNMRRGIELAAHDLAARGWKIDLAHEDDGTIPARTATALRALLQRGYRLFIGPAWSYLVEAASPLYATSDVVAYTPATCSEVAGGSNPHIFHGITPSSRKAGVVAAWLRERGFRRASILYADCAWGDVHSAMYERAAREAGVEIVSNEHFEYGSESSAIPAMVSRIGALHPDLILSTSSAEGSAAIVKRVRELRMNTAVLSTDDMLDAIQQKLIPKSQQDVPLFALTAPATEAFRALYRGQYHEEPGIYADSAYDGLMILATAFAGTDGSAAKMREFMRAGMNYRGVSGEFRYDSNGDVVKNTYRVVALGIP